jgi:hypothetical protein
VATPHAIFQAKRFSDGPENPKTVLGFRCMCEALQVPLTLPADACTHCTASKGLLQAGRLVQAGLYKPSTN